MRLTTTKLIALMEKEGVKLPEYGTGRNRRIVARDLEYALGTHYTPTREYNEHQLKHLELIRKYPPMKAFQYDKLRPEQQQEMWEDNNGWIAEEKYNGWRMRLTYINDGKKHSFMAWGGNLSTTDFLPKDYTEHIMLKAGSILPIDIPLSEFEPRSQSSVNFIVDCEVICKASVEGLDGRMSSNTLEAVQNIIGSSVNRARELQIPGNVRIEFYCFDTIVENSKLYHRTRKSDTAYAVENILVHNQFNTSHMVTSGKKRFCNQLWKAGCEGIILKNSEGLYVPGARHRDNQVKVKRRMSGDVGDDIDAFITGYIDTPEWSKEGLIGGIELAVNTNISEKPHHIATVTSMPLDMRNRLTYDKEAYLGKVLIVDGQELSGKNRRLMHARVNWDLGFRSDKNESDCYMEFEDITNVKF